jgi:hypothetical protein
MMDDAARHELAALADGTLAPHRRAGALARADAAALAAQREALAAIRAAAGEPASEALRESVAAMVAHASAPRDDRRRPATLRRPRLAFRPRLALAGAAATVLAAFALLGAATGPAGPSVAQAARLALSPARMAPPAARPDGTLAASVDGVAYPYWADDSRWRAVGERSDRLHGRTVRTVFYADGSARIGYAIAAGSPLSVRGGTTVERHGVRMRVLRSGPATVVTWLRGGHTCILAGRGVDAQALLALASWKR